MDSGLFLKQYDFELEQRNSLASAINIPIVALTALGGALGSMAASYQYANDLFTYFFLAFVILALTSLLISLYQTFKSFAGYVYEKIPSTTKLSAHYEELKKWYEEQGTDEKAIEQLATADFQTFLNDSVAKATDVNSQNNITRGNYLHGAITTIAFTFVFLLLSSSLYLYQKATSTEQIHQVKIVKQD